MQGGGRGMILFYKRIKWRRPQLKVEKSRLALFLFRALSMALAAGLLLRRGCLLRQASRHERRTATRMNPLQPLSAAEPQHA